MTKPCPCGSGKPREEAYDARRIFLAFVCPSCRKRRLAGYRAEVLTDPDYEATEDIEPS